MKLERLAHICMVTLAIASVANIGKWLHGTGENFVTAWGVAGATGAIVVTLAIILSRVDRNRDPALFWLMLAAVVAMCGLSGTLQFFAYSLHMERWQALLLGYSLPLSGEALVGLSMSMYDTYRRGEMLHNADDLADQQVAEQIAAAMGDLDLSKSKDYIQRKVDTLARRKIDATVQRLMDSEPETEQPTAQAPVQPSVQQPAQTERKKPVINSAEQAESDNPLGKVNEQRASKAEQRRSQLVKIVFDKGEVGASELSDLLGVSRTTVYNDIEVLDTVYRNGDGKIHPAAGATPLG